MGRLTFKNDIGHYALKTIFNAEIGIRMKSEVSKIFDAIDKLGELEDKTESGELVEVTRCKKCYFKDRLKECKNLDFLPNDFCSYGEKR